MGLALLKQHSWLLEPFVDLEEQCEQDALCAPAKASLTTQQQSTAVAMKATVTKTAIKDLNVLFISVLTIAHSNSLSNQRPSQCQCKTEMSYY